MDEDEMMKMMGFSGFGKAQKNEKKTVKVMETVKVVSSKDSKDTLKTFVNEEKEESNEIGNNELNQEQEEDDLNQEEEDDDDDESVDYTDRLPFAASCSLKDHDRTVTSMSLDPAHSRLVTASRDCMVKLWDFNSMKGNFKPFFSTEPAEGSPIRDVQWGIRGDCFLVIPSNWQPMLFDREGAAVSTFQKGDPYLRDLKNVKGHTAALTCGKWHPNDHNLFMTASLDSTIKVWDINNRQQCKSVLFTPAKGPGDKFGITSAVYSRDGKKIVSGDMGGSIKVWTSTGSQTRTEITIKDAHVKGNPITSIELSCNNYNIISRSMDDTLKLWDMRQPTKPVKVVGGLDIFHEETNCIYSPNEKYILTGTAERKDKDPGNVCVFDALTLEEVGRVEFASSCISLLWPSKMEQIFCGLGNGEVKVHYDPGFSNGGITVPIMNAERKLHVEDYDKFLGSVDIGGEILDDDNSAYIQEKERRKKLIKDRNAKRPEQPNTTRGAGKNGMIGVNQTQHIMKNILKNTTRSEDPRAAILKYAEIAENDPIWIAPAYKKTQSKTILAKSVYEDEAEAYRESKKQRRK